MEFKIGKPVPVPAKSSETYVLTVDFMHGDSDLYNSNVTEIDAHLPNALDILADGVSFLRYAQEAQPWSHPAREAFWQALRDLNVKHEYIFEDLICHDIQSGDCWAHVENFSVTYLDSCGIEYEVEIVG